MGTIKARQLIAGIDKPVSQITLGTAFYNTRTQDRWSEILDEFVQLGGTAIDTARGYGASEEVIGHWLNTSGVREGLVLITKCGLTSEGVLPAENLKELIETELATSLRTLNTDYVDVFMLHRDNPGLPVSDILEPLNETIACGQVKVLGASNWEYARLTEANEYAEKHGMAGFGVVSNNLSLARPSVPFYPGLVSADKQGEAWHAATGIPLIPWSSQARGFFTGRYTRAMAKEAPTDADAFTQRMLVCYGTEDNFTRIERASELGQRKGGYTAVEVALSWLLHRPFPIVPIVGTQTTSELVSCTKALTLDLTEDEQKWVDGVECGSAEEKKG